MTKRQYKTLRDKLYKAAGELGTIAEGTQNANLDASYRDMCNALDHIDMLGEQLGFVNPETNALIDLRFKRERVAGHYNTRVPK